jgi:large repetitive protein
MVISSICKGFRPFSTFSVTFQQLHGMKTLRLAGAVLAAGLLAGMPLAAQSTNFGSVNVGSSSASPVAVTLTIETSGTLGSIAVLTQGAANLDFTNAGGGTCAASTAYTVGETCTVNVTFKPTHPGPRYGGVELLDGSGNLLASGYVWGTGVGPQASFEPGSSITLSNGTSGLINPAAGLAVDGNGNVFVADLGLGIVFEPGTSGVKEIAAANGAITPIFTGPGYFQPSGLAVDGFGNVFVSDEFNNVVLELAAAGGYAIVKTLSGFSNPGGVAVDGSGNIFVVDTDNNEVKEFLAANGYTKVETLGSGFLDPVSVALDGNGNVFLTDSVNGSSGLNNVKEILVTGGYKTVTTLPSENSSIGFGSQAVEANGNLIVADAGNSGFEQILAAGGYAAVNTMMWTEIPGEFPIGTAVDQRGHVFVNVGYRLGANPYWPLVSRLDFADPPSLTFAITLPGHTSLNSPQTVRVQNDGNADLTFTALSYPTDFPEASGDANACTTSTSLGPGQACDLPIEFAPTESGPLNEQIVLTDNALNVTGTQQSIAASGLGEAPASLTPSSGTLGASQTFTWNNGTPATHYQLRVGTTGAGSSNLYDSHVTNTTTATVSIPQNGVDVYARLGENIGGAWQYTNYTFTESGAPVASVLNTPSPAPSPTLGTSETFTWTAGGGVTEYELELGTAEPGSSNLYDSEHTTALTSPVVTIPSYGFTVYARLFSYINRVWQHTDYTFTESGAAVASVLNTPSPAPNPTLGTSETFTWTAGGGVTEYELDLGTGGPGKSNLYNSGHTTALTSPVVAIPSKGSVVYARLWSYINKVWQHTDYTFTEP